MYQGIRYLYLQMRMMKYPHIKHFSRRNFFNDIIGFDYIAGYGFDEIDDYGDGFDEIDG